MGNQKEFDAITRDIKNVKIQGARNIAKAALVAYYLVPSEKSRKKLVSLRPTEPMMRRVLQMAKYFPKEKIMNHFDSAQDKINKAVFNLVKNKDIIFTHCHSTNVSKALVYAHKKGKRFQVYITETRPLYQGRKTAKEMQKAGINVTMFVDSAMATAIEKEGKKDKIYAKKIFIGADALLKKGVINKIGSRAIAELADHHNVPLYVIADSWKYTSERIPIEYRGLNEIWDKAPKKIKIKNPAFEFVPKKYIRYIVSELGVSIYDSFLKMVGKN